MGLAKQAKTLSRRQIALAVNLLNQTRYPIRNKAILLLSVKAGLRAKEIANLTWDMLTDAEGALSDCIRLENSASKGHSGGRVIPLNQNLKAALAELYREREPSSYVVTSERGPKMSPVVIVNLFASWYRDLGFTGCSSHSGRRTFITNAARQISMVGGSLRDIQALAGHSALSTTQRYIEADVEAQTKVVELV